MSEEGKQSQAMGVVTSKGELGAWEQKAVRAFEVATAEFVAHYGGVPHCPRCGVEAIPNPLPWIVGAETWSCRKDDFRQAHGDFRSWESMVPPRNWTPSDRHPAYIHEAFSRRGAVVVAQ